MGKEKPSPLVKTSCEEKKKNYRSQCQTCLELITLVITLTIILIITLIYSDTVFGQLFILPGCKYIVSLMCVDVGLYRRHPHLCVTVMYSFITCHRHSDVRASGHAPGSLTPRRL